MSPRRSNRKVLSLVPFFLADCSILLGFSAAEKKTAAEGAVSRFHTQLDAEQYDQIYSEASAEFQKSVSRADFQQFLAAVHQKLGKTQHSDEKGIR